MFASVFGVLLASVSPINETPHVTSTSRTFDAWQMRCETLKSESSSQSICGLVSSITIKGPDGKPAVATVVMFRPVAETGSYQLSMELPLGVWLPSGVILRDANQNELLTLPFVSCHSQGCQAGSIIGSESMSKFASSGNSASATYELQIRKTATLSFSMKGFQEALEALTHGKAKAAS